MSQNKADGNMNELKGLVAQLQSGSNLITALEAKSLQNSEIPQLMSAVLKEYKSSANGTVVAPRANLDEALSVISQLMFITPRYVILGFVVVV